MEEIKHTVASALKPFTKICRLGKVMEYVPSAHGEKPVSVFVKIQYTERDQDREGFRLSITGVIGPTRGGNAFGSCGQINSTLENETFVEYAPGWDISLVKRFLEVWDRYHLNDCTAGTPKQEEFLRNKKATDTLSENKNAREQGHLLDMTEPDGFSSADVRNAFLRFIVTVFVNYERFLLTDSGRHLFDEEKFLDSQNLDMESRSFLQRVLESQMFQRFLEERNEAPEDPEIRFFDESIIAKHNRSKATTLTTGGKKKTPFLDDESWKVSSVRFCQSDR